VNLAMDVHRSLSGDHAEHLHVRRVVEHEQRLAAEGHFRRSVDSVLRARLRPPPRRVTLTASE
jgi:hypothetical protein